MNKLKNTIALAGVLALLAPASAFASSAGEAYNGLNGVENLQQQSPTTPSNNAPATDSNSPSKQVKKAESGTLPFTGADLGVIGGAGVLLVGFGFGLRRLTQRPTPQV